MSIQFRRSFSAGIRHAARGEITEAGEQHWYKVHLIKGRSVVIYVDGADAWQGTGETLEDPHVFGVYQGDEKLGGISDNNKGKGLNSAVQFFQPPKYPSAWYYICVGSANNGVGTYRIWVLDVQFADDYPSYISSYIYGNSHAPISVSTTTERPANGEIGSSFNFDTFAVAVASRAPVRRQGETGRIVADAERSTAQAVAGRGL